MSGMLLPSLSVWGKGHFEEAKVKGNAEYTIYTYKHIPTCI